MRVEDLVGFDKLLSGGGPLLTLSMGFLNSNNVVVVKKFVEGLFLSFPAGFGHAFSGKKTVGIPRGKREGGGIVGEDAISGGLAVGLTGLGQVSGLRLGVASGWLQMTSWFEQGPRVKVASGGQASD